MSIREGDARLQRNSRDIRFNLVKFLGPRPNPLPSEYEKYVTATAEDEMDNLDSSDSKKDSSTSDSSSGNSATDEGGPVLAPV